MLLVHAGHFTVRGQAVTVDAVVQHANTVIRDMIIEQ